MPSRCSPNSRARWCIHALLSAPLFLAAEALAEAASMPIGSAWTAQQPVADDWAETPWEEEAPSPWRALNGFVELGRGERLQSPAAGNGDATLREARVRFDTGYDSAAMRVNLKGDLIYDDLRDGWESDLRDLNLQFSPAQSWDVKAGRQVLTWGTGDYLFLNDLFPKDWQAFFSGRDDEYLKAASDSLKVSRYGERLNFNLVWTPQFTPDRFLSGERFSFFAPQLDSTIAPQPPVAPDTPSRSTWAGRLFFTSGQQEWAFYGYRGYDPQPRALNTQGQANFSRLNVLGASVLSPWGSGLANAEIAYHQSPEDNAGNDPLVPNSQWRFLIGYQQEWVRNLTVALQYYLEWTQDYDVLLANSPAPQFEPDEYRHLLTLRLNHRMLQDKLTLDLFSFYSPSDQDHYLRPNLNYRFDDQWSLSLGANLFGGDHTHSFFGQLEENSNAYLRLRFHY